MRVYDRLVLFRCPFVLFYVWVQVVVPALAALLPDAAGQGLSNVAPVLSAELTDVID